MHCSTGVVPLIIPTGVVFNERRPKGCLATDMEDRRHAEGWVEEWIEGRCRELDACFDSEYSAELMCDSKRFK
jgi:hypothetical protein